MELSSSIFTTVLSPLAAFPGPDDAGPGPPDPGDPPPVGGWAASPLNPKNRIDSLAPQENPTWRIDGAHLDGQRFFAVPTFALGRPPLRVDVHIPPVEDLPHLLREVLKPEEALYARRSAVPGLSISQHLVRALGHWSSRIPDFQEKYLALPFGSRILVTHITASLEHTEVHLVPAYEVEQDLLGLSVLRDRWASRIPPTSLPGTLDWAYLSFVRQIAETISLVRIPSRHGVSELVFKSLTRDTRHMYHELGVLLSLEPHPSIISRPLYVVEKRGRFGGRKSVCGFVLEYFPMGTLQDRLSSTVPTSLSEQFRWGRQVAEALVHVASQEGEGWFYPDLKPDNVVLRPSPRGGGEADAVLLDFEQRGGWFGWSPPEVLAVEYLEALAADLPRGPARKQARDLLLAYIPVWQAELRDGGETGQAWRALAGREDGAALDRAQVFVLGKLLWCIFEGQATVRCGMDHELLRDAEPDGPAFPECRRAPEEVQGLIRRCTLGACEPLRPVAVKGGSLVLSRSEGGAGGSLPAEVVLEASRSWWRGEVEAAKDVVRQLAGRRPGRVDDTSILGLMRQRPRLTDVVTELVRLEKKIIDVRET